MKKYSKTTNGLVSFENKIPIYSDISCIPNMNGLAIVENSGLYNVNGSTKTNILPDKPSQLSGFIVGEVLPFIGDTIPNGFLECNGSQFSSSLYPELYSLLGTNVVPDFREEYLVGGSTVGTFSDDSIACHTHRIVGTHDHPAKSCNAVHYHQADGNAQQFTNVSMGCKYWANSATGLQKNWWLKSSKIGGYTCSCHEHTVDSDCRSSTWDYCNAGVCGISTYGSDLYTAPKRYLVKYLIYAGE